MCMKYPKSQGTFEGDILKSRTTYFDENTGEVFSEKIKSIIAYFDDEKGYLFWNRKTFSKMFDDIEFPTDLSDSEIGKLTKLSKNMYSNTNMLAYHGNGGVKPHDIKTIAKMLKISERQSRMFVNKMIKLGILGKAKYEVENTISYQYYMNPIYYCSSNRIPLNLYLIFKKQLDEVLPEWVKRKYSEIKGKDKEKEG